MPNKPPHTFTWLKVLAVFFTVEVLALALIIRAISDAFGSNKSTSFSYLLIFIGVSIVSLSGLLFGYLLNLLSKFKMTVLVYSLGHILALIAFFIIGYKQSETRTQEPATINSDMRPVTENAVTPPIIQGEEKIAIEEVIYLMEQQYPFGAYNIVDIVTEYHASDSSAIVCTIVFTLSEENNKKYISQYLVRNGRLDVVYARQDTASSAYSEYKLKK